MRGTLNLNYFGLEEPKTLPHMILTTAKANQITHFTIERLTDSESLLTISSTAPLSNDILSSVLKDRKTVLEHSWEAAYPVFKVADRLPPSHLDERLMYINSIESTVSSMETSAYSALNAIKTIKYEFGLPR